MTLVLVYLVVILVSFLLGSIPWGFIISSKMYHIDIRTVGSGNIGSTNVFRILGVAGGLGCFVLDFLKGFFGGLFALAFALDLLSGGIACNTLGGAHVVKPFIDNGLFSISTLTSLAFMSCVLGHVFSPWLHFKGGKGVAVGAGCLFITFGWQFACIELIIFLLVVIATKYISAGSVSAAGACLLISTYLFLSQPLAMLFCWVGALTIIWAHRGNIKRLRAGEENKFSVRKD